MTTTIRSSASARSASTWPDTAAVASRDEVARSQLSGSAGTGARSRGSAIVGPDLGQRRGRVGGRQVAEVPRAGRLHVADALALDRVRDQHLRPLRRGRRQRRERAEQRRRCRGRRPRSRPSRRRGTCRRSARPPSPAPVSPSRPIRLRSTIAQTLPSPKCDAACAASHTWPSFSSWSPSSTQMRTSARPRSRAAAAMPVADRQAVPERSGREVDARHASHVGVVAERAAEAGVLVQPRRAGSSRARPAAGRRRRRSGPSRGSAGRGPARPGRRAGASRRSTARRGSRPPRRRSCSGRSSRSRSAGRSRGG